MFAKSEYKFLSFTGEKNVLPQIYLRFRSNSVAIFFPDPWKAKFQAGCLPKQHKDRDRHVETEL